MRFKEEDVEKTTFRTHYGHCLFVVMSFELNNTLEMFMDWMNRVCKLMSG